MLFLSNSGSGPPAGCAWNWKVNLPTWLEPGESHNMTTASKFPHYNEAITISFIYKSKPFHEAVMTMLNVLCFIQVFFRTGCLAQLEDAREEKIAGTVIGLQSLCRGHLARQRLNRLKVIQFWSSLIGSVVTAHIILYLCTRVCVCPSYYCLTSGDKSIFSPAVKHVCLTVLFLFTVAASGCILYPA